MNLTLLSSAGFVGGLFALAGGLYLLQRLRVRHREVDVVTTIFWHEAVHETRARMLVQRFRHPWAYALILAICALLWSAFAAPERDFAPAERYVFLLDNSAGMARGTRFGEVTGQLLAMVEEAPREAREVIACGAQLERLLLPGEESLLLAMRLAGLKPEATPSSVQRAIDALALQANVPTTVLVFGDTPLDGARLALLPENLTVETVNTHGADFTPEESTGITALGVSLAQSGAWDAVDVLIEIWGNHESPPEPSLALDGAPLTLEVTRRELAPGNVQYVVRDVPARGGRFEVRLPADSLTLDDSAALVLPNRPLLRVALSPSLDEALRPALESDPAVVLVTENAVVAVRRANETIGQGLPALVFAPAATQEHSFLVQDDGERPAQAVLAEAVGALALGEIDATSLAEVADQPITVGTQRGEQREVSVWEELVGDGFDLVDSRAFPLFVGGSVRWLAASEDFAPWIAAGETALANAGLRTANGTQLRSAGLSMIPPTAGEYVTGAGGMISVSLLSAGATPGQARGGADTPLEAAAGGAADPITWLLLIAALLLFFEWRLVRTGRMP